MATPIVDMKDPKGVIALLGTTQSRITAVSIPKVISDFGTHKPDTYQPDLLNPVPNSVTEVQAPSTVALPTVAQTATTPMQTLAMASSNFTAYDQTTYFDNFYTLL